MNDNEPDFRTPGQLIQHLLEERGWTQKVLSIVLGVSTTIVTRMINGQRPVDASMAVALGEVFDVPPGRFLLLQGKYDLKKAQIEAIPDPRREIRAQLYTDFPIAEMARRGWIDVENTSDVRRVESELAAFFGVDSAEEIAVMPHAAKKTDVGGDVTMVQLAWLRRVRRIAESIVLDKKYSARAMRSALKKLHALLASPDEARHVPRILAEAGVRFVVVESVPGAKIDGVCFWLDDHSPVIGMTMRFDRIDNFWFVLRHECEHVLRGDGREVARLDNLERNGSDAGPDIEEEERRANEAAADFCVPTRTLNQFIARKAPIFTERDIRGFAKVVNVHPGLVAGQLQHATQRYDRFRSHLVGVRGVVLPAAIHDGWGDIAPLA